jgi:hypothetical protein
MLDEEMVLPTVLLNPESFSVPAMGFLGKI